MVMNLLSSIGKDFKIFARSKTSAAIIILAPLLIVLLIGMAFNSSALSSVSIGVHSAAYSGLSDSIVASFETDGYLIKKLESQDECVESVKTGQTHICIIFPSELSALGNAESVVFHADKSRANIAYSLINDVNSKISVKTSELGAVLAQDLINAVSDAKESLAVRKTEVDSSIGFVISSDSKAAEAVSFIPSFANSLSKLNDAKKILDGMNSSAGEVSSLRNEVDNIIAEINLLQNRNSELINSLDSIKAENTNVKTVLSSVSSDLDLLIKNLNSVKATDAANVVSPIKTEVKSISSDLTNMDSLFPTSIALLVLFGSIILSSTLVLREKATKAYFRNFATPTSDFVFLLGTFFTCLIILVVQLAILFAGVAWIGNVSIASLSVFGNISFVLLISMMTFIFLGMFIGYAFKSEETAILAAISVASLLIFFSNTILPIESIASSFQLIARYNPLVVLDSALRKMILFNASIGSVFKEITKLGIALVVFFGLAFGAREMTRRDA